MRFATGIVYGTLGYWCQTFNPILPPGTQEQSIGQQHKTLHKWSILYLADALDLGGECSMQIFQAYIIVRLETHQTSPIILYYSKDCKVSIAGLTTFSIPVVEGYVE